MSSVDATNSTGQSSKPVRVGVFNQVSSAARAIQSLLNAGFTRDEITVICSDQYKERYFSEFEHQEPAGSRTVSASLTGGAIGAALGTLTVLAGIVATGGVALVAAGGLAAWTGGVLGGLVGAMMTRGVEKEVADYYDQAVLQGKILVSVETHGQDQAARLATAERALAEAGAEPIPLLEG